MDTVRLIMFEDVSDFVCNALKLEQKPMMSKIGEGLFAHVFDINHRFIAKVAKNTIDTEYQHEEHVVLADLNRIGCKYVPRLIKSGKLKNGNDILIEEKVLGDVFSYQKYLALPKEVRQRFLTTYGKVCANFHAIRNIDLGNRLYRTSEYQLLRFLEWYTPDIKTRLSPTEQAEIIHVANNFIKSKADVRLVPCHADLHFNNIIVDQDFNIAGIIDFGAFHYADPAYEFRYMLGEPSEFLEKGYGQHFGHSFYYRQLFYCVCMFLMGAAQPSLSWVSKEENIKRLQKLLRIKHMEKSYM